VARLQAHVDSNWKDDYSANQALRRKFRTEKKLIKEVEEQKAADIARFGVPLLPLAAADREAAASVRFQAQLSAEARSKQKRLALLSGPIFVTGRPSGGAGQHKTQSHLEKHRARIVSSWQSVDKRTLDKRAREVGPQPKPKRTSLQKKLRIG